MNKYSHSPSYSLIFIQAEFQIVLRTAVEQRLCMACAPT